MRKTSTTKTKRDKKQQKTRKEIEEENEILKNMVAVAVNDVKHLLAKENANNTLDTKKYIEAAYIKAKKVVKK